MRHCPALLRGSDTERFVLRRLHRRFASPSSSSFFTHKGSEPKALPAEEQDESGHRGGDDKPKWRIDGHLLAYFMYLFIVAVAEVSLMGLMTSK